MSKSEKKSANLYVTLIVILMSIAVVAAVAGAVSRNISKKPAETAAQTDGTDVTSPDDGSVTEDVFMPGTETDTGTETSDDAAVLPEFINPTGGKLLNAYSVEVPVFSSTMEDYRTHTGVDIFVAEGERILACADGTVKEVWEDPLMGNCISLEHSGGAVSCYIGISPDLPEGIAPGRAVTSGTFIAVSGDTALIEVSEEPHVHFELKINGASVNPADYIDFSDASESYEG